jgi:5-formyltetrahydrofolate cyclo-ligase
MMYLLNSDFRSGKKVFQTLLQMKEYEGAKRVSVYLSMPCGEIQTDEIVRHALSAGKEVFVPYLYENKEDVRLDGEPGPKKIMDMVKLKSLEDYEGLERDSWGIPTVMEQSLEGRDRILGTVGEKEVRKGLDLLLLPGVAFDAIGQPAVVNRLGHGKGFYDYFLHRYGHLSQEGVIDGFKPDMTWWKFGLALREQYLDKDKNLQVPMGPYDQHLDGLVVGDGQVIK